jgi:hypothetical protein
MQDTNLNLQPYFDDYNRDKGYYKILFKPGTSVQARELTTLQSMLQNQIERFGQHTFKDGSVVIPGQIGFNLIYNAVLVQPYISGGSVEQVRSSLVGKKIKGSQSGVTAEVLDSISAEESEKGLITLYVKYISSGNDTDDNEGQPGTSQYTKFINNEILLDENGLQVASTYTQNASSYSGSAAFITTGVYFIRGFFVEVPEQAILLDQYSSKPSYKVGLDIIESIVTAEDDSSLYDNAAGSTNYAAPGADRLKIEAILTKKDLSFSDTSSFIELLRLNSGEVVELNKLVENSFYNELEKNLARRTYDESGNYSLQPFDVKIKETFDNEDNNGIYKLNELLPDGRKVLNYKPTDQDGNAINGNDYYTLVVSEGKAYVKGFEINNIGKSYATIEKPRKFSSKNNQGTEFNVGTYFELDPAKILGSVSTGSVVSLNRVVNNVSTNVGKARVSSLSTTSTNPKLHVLDFTLYTTITVTANVGTNVVAGNFVFFNNNVEAIVESVTAGATSTLILRNVTGSIVTGLKFTSSKNSTEYTVGNSITQYKTSDIDSITATGFSATPKLDSYKITGSGFYLNASAEITGNSTNFTQEVRPGMKLLLGTTEVTVSSVDSSKITLVNSGLPAVGTYDVKRLVAAYRSENSNLYIKILDTPIKSVSDISYYKLATETKTVSSDGKITLSPSSDYTISSSDILIVKTSGNPSVINYTVSNLSTGIQISVSDSSLNNQTVSVTYKLRVNNPTLKTKNYLPFKFLKVVETSSSSAYGTRISDSSISLKFSDVNQIYAIHESNTSSVSDFTTLFDRLTVNTSSGITTGDVISVSNSRATVIAMNGNTLYVKYSSSSKVDPGNNLSLAVKVITNYDLTGIFVTSSAHGSYKDITSSFNLAVNDNAEFYNVSKLVRNKNSTSPANPFIVVYGFFEHNNTSNDFYTVTSYNFDQISYDEIRTTSDKIFNTEIIDFRHETATSSTSGGSISAPYQETTSALDPYAVNRIIGNTVQPSSLLTYDYDCYLGRIDKVYLTENGLVNVVKGSDSLNPSPPQVVNNDMLLATVYLPPYLRSISSASITPESNPRYTMKDISNLENRLETVENITSLNLLEINTNTLNVLDDDGNNRFKNGFIVDNFKSISFADVDNSNYTASLNTTTGVLRPLPYTNSVDLEYYPTTSTVKTHRNSATIPYTEFLYAAQQYASRVENLQPFEIANWIGEITLSPSRDIWYDTVRSQNETQTLDLATPLKALFDMSGGEGYNWDDWQTTSVSYRYNWWWNYYGYYPYYYNGYYPYNYGYYGYGYNYYWGWGRWRGYYSRYWGWYGYYPYSQTVTQERTGTYNTFNETTQDIKLGDTFNGMTSIKLTRSRIVELYADKLKPNTNFNFLIDDKEQNGLIYPKDVVGMTERSGTFVIGEKVMLVPIEYSDDLVTTQGLILPVNNQIEAEVIASPLGAYTSSSTFISIDKINTAEEDGINPDYLENKYKIIGKNSLATGTVTLNEQGVRVKSDDYGNIRAFVLIPPMAFETGDLKFALNNTLQVDVEGISDTSAESVYYSQGTEVDVSSNTLAIKSANITSTPVTQKRTQTITPWSWCPNWDPIAQSFFVTEEGGIFITAIEVFFQSKDSIAPVSIELRIMENGNITDKVVDNSNTTVASVDVKVSSDATLPTKFVFNDPIYLNQGSEYAFIVRSTSKQYKIWVSRLSENDVTTGFYIDKQPYIGSLFKSQNLSTWTADQFQDVKFNLYRARFQTNTTYTCTLKNKPLPDIKLNQNPLQFTQDTSLVTVLHPNHGMNGTQNYVRLTNIESDIQPTTLSSALNSTTTSGTIALGLITGGDWNKVNNATVSSTNPGYVLVGKEIIQYTSVSGSNLTISARGQFETVQSPHAAGTRVVCYNLNGVPISELSKTHKIVSVIDLDRYVISVTAKANATANKGGNQIWVSRNIPFELITPNISMLNPSSTQVNMSSSTVAGNKLFSSSSFALIQNEAIENNSQNKLTTPRVVLSNQNKSTYFNDLPGSFSVTLNLSTTKDNLSPIIYFEGSSVRTASNRVKKILDSNGNLNFQEELTPLAGTNSAYVSKKVTLTNPSTSIKVLLDAVRMAGLSGDYSDIKVFAKIKYDGTSSTFSELNYIEIPAKTYPTSSSEYDFKAFDFELTSLAEFKEFSIKIVMFSSDQTNVPLIKNFRAIALAV